MDISLYFEIFWKFILLSIITLIGLELGGSKSISQVSVAHFVVLVALGDYMFKEIPNKGIMSSVVGLGTLIAFLIGIDYLKMKFNSIEKLIDGDAILLVDNGELVVKNMKKLQITVDTLEMLLREQGISSFLDCKSVTLESNGQIGFELKQESAPLTYQDFKTYMDQRFSEVIGKESSTSISTFSSENLFTEVRKGQNVENSDFNKNLE